MRNERGRELMEERRYVICEGVRRESLLGVVGVEGDGADGT